MDRATDWADGALARRFVQRLTESVRADWRPGLAPVLDRDPYLSAWTNVEAALGAAPAPEQDRIRRLLGELDAEVGGVGLPPAVREAARRAVRGLLARRWLLTRESLTFLYEPFESVIPIASLEDRPRS